MSHTDNTHTLLFMVSMCKQGHIMPNTAMAAKEILNMYSQKGCLLIQDI